MCNISFENTKEVNMTRTFLTDYMWEKLHPHLPAEWGRKCRPPNAHRIVMEGIIWKLRTGAPWRDIPEEFGSWNTIYSRFYRWSRSGLLEEILEVLKGEADTEWIMLDSSVVRAHQHAAGAKGGRNRKH
jgi:putative transposase